MKWRQDMISTLTSIPIATRGEHGGATADRAPLTNILVRSLLTSGVGNWPGCDGLLIDEVLDEYTRAAAANLVPGELDLCEYYPALSAQIVGFFYLHSISRGHV